MRGYFNLFEVDKELSLNCHRLNQSASLTCLSSKARHQVCFKIRTRGMSCIFVLSFALYIGGILIPAVVYLGNCSVWAWRFSVYHFSWFTSDRDTEQLVEAAAPHLPCHLTVHPGTWRNGRNLVIKLSGEEKRRNYIHWSRVLKYLQTRRISEPWLSGMATFRQRVSVWASREWVLMRRTTLVIITDIREVCQVILLWCDVSIIWHLC